jgi:hypothetical protein
VKAVSYWRLQSENAVLKQRRPSGLLSLELSMCGLQSVSGLQSWHLARSMLAYGVLDTLNA